MQVDEVAQVSPMILHRCVSVSVVESASDESATNEAILSNLGDFSLRYNIFDDILFGDFRQTLAFNIISISMLLC